MSAPALRHFVDLATLDTATLRGLLQDAHGFKARRRTGADRQRLAGRTLALIFERNSTRTRVSFEVGMRELGGDALVLTGDASQISRGETIADTARVLSRYVDAVMLRTDSPEKLADLVRHATIPVINGLTSASHPCQIMADLMTLQEHRGPLEGKVVAWLGDGNNVSCSWIKAAAHFGITLRLACPPGYEPPADVIAWAHQKGGDVSLVADPQAAVEGAQCVITDTWMSMSTGEEERERRFQLLEPYQVNAALMKRAAPDALFMHCLPAHRGEEVTQDVIDGPQSVVWDEAENRLHAQKAVLTWCLVA